MWPQMIFFALIQLTVSTFVSVVTFTLATAACNVQVAARVNMTPRGPKMSLLAPTTTRLTFPS